MWQKFRRYSNPSQWGLKFSLKLLFVALLLCHDCYIGIRECRLLFMEHPYMWYREFLYICIFTYIYTYIDAFTCIQTNHEKHVSIHDF